LRIFPSKANFTQQYLRSQPPAIEHIIGKSYVGYLVPVGICWTLSEFITNNLFGPGRWYGKRISAHSYLYKNSMGKQQAVMGENIFHGRNKMLVPCRNFVAKEVKSALDRKPALLLSYFEYNRFHPIAFGMTDELRQLDDNGDVLIGCGGLAFSGGLRNFAPFLLIRSRE
jgi:hypothetical protein